MIQYQPHFIPQSVWLIGAGGTGSRLMPMLVQLVRSCLNDRNPRGHLLRCPIFVVDGDEVETKNLLRQNFIEQDVGRNKAVVVAERYGQGFNMEVYASDQFLKADSHIPTFEGYSDTLPRPTLEGAVVILGVDSAKARRDILSFVFGPNSGLRGSGNLLVVDAGNEDAFGQVLAWTPHVITQGSGRNPKSLAAKFPELTMKDYSVPFLPIDLRYYSRLGESAQELSCEALPQTLCVNALAAINILRILQNFFMLKPWPFQMLRFHMGGGDSTEMLSAAYFKRAVLEGYASKVGYLSSGRLDFWEGDSKGIHEWVSYGRVLEAPWRAFFEHVIEDTEAEYAKIGMRLGSNGEMLPDPSRVVAPAAAPAAPETVVPPLVPAAATTVDLGGVPPLPAAREIV